MQVYTPALGMCLSYSPVKGASVPFSRITRNCSGERMACHSEGDLVSGYVWSGMLVVEEVENRAPRRGKVGQERMRVRELLVDGGPSRGRVLGMMDWWEKMRGRVRLVNVKLRRMDGKDGGRM